MFATSESIASSKTAFGFWNANRVASIGFSIAKAGSAMARMARMLAVCILALLENSPYWNRVNMMD